MNILKWLFGPSVTPVMPPLPATSSAMELVRSQVSVAISRLKARNEAAQKRREGATKLEASNTTAHVETRSSIRSARGAGNARYSVSSTRTVLKNSFEALDPRAFSRRLMSEVNKVYGGDPVPFYTAAGLSRSTYSKLISHPECHPSKETVLSMAAALKMNASEAEQFLQLAGYALSDSIPSDIVWKACFSGGVHHLPQIKQLLAEFNAS